MSLWSLVVMLMAAFVIGWAAETAQTFLPRAVALSILAWLQTLPEFAVEADIAWNQERDLMIANLTGSLRLLVGLGLPMIFFVHLFFNRVRTGKFAREIVIEDQDSLGVCFLFMSILYFIVILAKGNLTCWDSLVLVGIYVGYLILSLKLPSGGEEEVEDLPWIGKKIVLLAPPLRLAAVLALFAVGGGALYVSTHPFISTLQKWSISMGISTFVFVQWVAPFLSEFPEKVSAFNWARQDKKAPLGVMNMVNSNINQWTMLAAMIPITFNLSLGHYEPIFFDRMHTHELALTIAQSMLAGMLLLDLRFSVWDAGLIFILWFVQFVVSELRMEVTLVYATWTLYVLGRAGFDFAVHRRLPRAVTALARYPRFGMA